MESGPSSAQYDNDSNYNDANIANKSNFILSGNNNYLNKTTYESHRSKCENIVSKNNVYNGNNKTNNNDCRTYSSEKRINSNNRFQESRGELITDNEINRLIQERYDVQWSSSYPTS